MGQKPKIVLVLLFALIFSTILNRTVFLANTPHINRNFIAKLKASPSRFLSFLSKKLFPSKETMQVAGLNLPQVKDVPNIPFQPISKNVYAGYDTKSNTQYITIKKGAKMQVRIYKIKMSDGTEKEIKLLIPTK